MTAAASLTMIDPQAIARHIEVVFGYRSRQSRRHLA